MIGVDGEYRFSIFLKDQKNIISENDMLSFTIIEATGLILPYFEVAFSIKDKSKLEYFNDKNVLNIQLGKDTNSLKDTELHVEKVIESPAQTDVGTVVIRGVHNSKPYLSNTLKKAYPNMTSLDVLSSIASKYKFKTVANVSAMKDKMTWDQANKTDFFFANEVWKHNYLKDNAFCLGSFNIENQFRFEDIVQKISSSDIKFNFVTSKPENDKETQICSDFETDNNTSVNNLFGGYVRTKEVYNMTTRKYSTIDISGLLPIISEAKEPNNDTSISKSGGFEIQTPLMHENYYKAELLNTTRLFNMNSSRIWITIEDTYSDIHPLDLCTVLAKEGNNQSTEQISGLYLVSKVVRTIQDRRLVTSALLCRESFNNQR